MFDYVELSDELAYASLVGIAFLFGIAVAVSLSFKVVNRPSKRKYKTRKNRKIVK